MEYFISVNCFIVLLTFNNPNLAKLNYACRNRKEHLLVVDIDVTQVEAVTHFSINIITMHT